MTITQYPSSTNNQYSSKRHQRAQRHPKQANTSKSCKVLTPNQSHPKHQQLKTNHKPLLIPLHSTPQQANHRTRRKKKNHSAQHNQSQTPRPPLRIGQPPTSRNRSISRNNKTTSGDVQIKPNDG